MMKISRYNILKPDFIAVESAIRCKDLELLAPLSPTFLKSILSLKSAL